MALKKLVQIIALIGMVVLFASACNTIRGVGKDVERGGEKIQKVAS